MNDFTATLHAAMSAPRLPKKKDYWFPTAFSSWDDKEHDAIERVIMSGRFTMGEEVAAFEKEFAAYHGKRHAIMVNSGSSANLIIVAALQVFNKVWIGARAAVPAIAWSTTYAPFVQHHVALSLFDVDDSWNGRIVQDWAKSKPDVVVGCSILGSPANLQLLKEQADEVGAIFIEDNCESLGASRDANAVYQGRLCGTYGLMSSFSLFYSHQISAIEGGVILTDDDECANMCRILRAHGWTRDVKPAESFSDEYSFVQFGYNVRPLEMHAAIAREQLKKLDLFIKARRTNLEHFKLVTGDLPVTHQKTAGWASPFGLAFTVSPKAKVNRAALAWALRAKGIDCRLPTGGSFHLHPYGATYAGARTPVADHIHNNGMFLGNAPYDITEKIDAAVKVMREELGYRGPVIGVTGNAVVSDVDKYLAHGADAVLTKPLNVTRLEECLAGM